MKFEQNIKSRYISGSGRKGQKTYLDLYKNYLINQFAVWNNRLPVASFPQSLGEDILSLTLMNSGFHPWPSGYWISIIMSFRALFESSSPVNFFHMWNQDCFLLSYLSPKQGGFVLNFHSVKRYPPQMVKSPQKKLYSFKTQAISNYLPF